MTIVLYRKHLRVSTAYYGDTFTFLYGDDVRTSQKTQNSTDCCVDGFTFIHIDVLTSQETRLWLSTGSYGNIFNIYV
jgi:hypothetical protein